MIAQDSGLSLLTVDEMYRADQLAVEQGVAGIELMETAGRAVAEAVMAREERRPVCVLCGPGNNGGDGFVAARVLQEAGWPVTLRLLGARETLRGDAAHHAALWSGPAEGLSVEGVEPDHIVIDALFGAGLARALEGPAKDVVQWVNDKGATAYAVDVPSGLSGDTGAVVGDVALRASVTVTFFRAKPGHLLLPGRLFCGELLVADIGIPEAVLGEIRPRCRHNDPRLWSKKIPRRELTSHKYRFGHALISGGPELVGASILAARAALRVGAGLVTMAASPAAWAACASALPSAICRRIESEVDFSGLLLDSRINSVAIGPGAGVTADTRARVKSAGNAGKALVLDADALTAFAERPEELFRIAPGNKVLTPHEGEFARVFGGIEGDKLTRSRAAAAASDAVVLLKGADTVIAGPDGRAVICDNAPAWLATAGSGDVLAGLIVGLLAQGLTPFDAAAAGAWIHGEAASDFGPGMISQDLPDAVPRALPSDCES
jgi:NAD(P)H-hydrate epimerase